ncbi:hypothetical protein [Siccirubricoccus phaeus]|uniref:hypothetical protein n=1 Tax=Siccirubricoccus phaeus TaxID=2595053 RepID=UPI0011F0A3D6|nr:hypothetical protein [Siccirubricoccus phaeus]
MSAGTAPPEAALRPVAAALGPAFGGFLRGVAETARARGAPAVWFLSGEGQWFAATYARLCAALGGGFPPARHLAISRRASFLPSLERLDRGALAPLLAQYTSASLGGVLASLGLALPAAALAAGGLDPAQPWAEQAARALALPALRDAAEARRAAQRALLLRFLAQQGFPAAGEALVADIGWRGSIQDNLCRLLPALRLHGCYFLLLPGFSPAPANATRQSFLLPPGPREARRLRFGAPLELAVGGEGGSVIGYAAAGSGAAPVAGPPPACPPAARRALAGFRAALAEAAVARQARPEVALRDTLRFLEHPPRAFAALYFAHERDERYGTGRSHLAAAPLKAGALLSAVGQAGARRRLGLALAESGWPWALLQRDLPWLLPLLRPVLMRLDPRLENAPRMLGAATSRAAPGGRAVEWAR